MSAHAYAVTDDGSDLRADLEASLRLEELLADLAARFMNRSGGANVGAEIERAQGMLCTLLGFDRSTIWHLADPRGDAVQLLRIFQPSGAPEPPPRMDARTHYPYIMSELAAGRPVLVSRLADLPPEAERDRAALRHYGAKSTAVLPLHADGRLFAVMTFATVYAERDWPVSLVRRLELVGQVFASALVRIDADVALQEVSGRLINAQEKERARLAQELHDGMSQQLAVLAVELQLLSRRLPSTGVETRARLGELSEKTKALSSEVHRLAHALHPAKLERLGLVAAVGGFCRELEATERLRVRFSASDVPERIPRDRSLAIYRVTQEALWNVIRHSGALCAMVTLTGGDAELRLDILDDGRGFDPAGIKAPTSLGLLGMRERVVMLGGQIRWEPRAGGGTAVRVRMPLPVTLSA